MMRNGMNLARINMSSIQHKEHKVLVRMIRKAAEVIGVQCGICVELQGPVIKLGEFDVGASVRLEKGQKFRIYPKKAINGNKHFASCDYLDLADKVKEGQKIIVDFGAVSLKVVGFQPESEFLEEFKVEGKVYQSKAAKSLLVHGATPQKQRS
jgi:pyruvate kinase